MKYAYSFENLWFVQIIVNVVRSLVRKSRKLQYMYMRVFFMTVIMHSTGIKLNVSRFLTEHNGCALPKSYGLIFTIRSPD